MRTFYFRTLDKVMKCGGPLRAAFRQWLTSHSRAEPHRKRHILVDTLGLLLNVVFHPANFQDRDGAVNCCAGANGYSRSSNAFLLTADTRDARWR